MRVFLSTAILLCIAACGEVPYPPPPQRAWHARPVRAVLEMRSDWPVQPWASIINDVLPGAPGTDWRWVRSHPGFEFRLKDGGHWMLSVRLTAVAKVLDAVGPQRVAFMVNGVAVGKAVLDHAGSFNFSFPVGQEAFGIAAPVKVQLDFDPCLISDSPQEKGLAYCVLLHSIGFVQDQT